MRSSSRIRWPAHRDDQRARARALMLSREDGLDVPPIDDVKSGVSAMEYERENGLIAVLSRPLSRIS